MIITVEWEVFHTKYLNQNTVFAKENPTNYEFYTYDGVVIIKTMVPKKENAEENIMFIERYFSGRTNIVRALEIEDSVIPIQEEEPLEEKNLEEEQGIEDEDVETKQEEPKEKESGDKPWQEKPWKEKPWKKKPVIPAKER